MSTAMIGLAPASAEPAIAATPTPPQPITATDLPRVTAPVLIAAPMPAITPQPSRPTAAGGPTGRPSCTGRRRPGSSPRTRRCPAPARARCRVALGERHLLGRVVGVEAVLQVAALAGPALAADRTPVEDHEVAGSDAGDVGADRLDHAGGLVAEQEREVVVDAALAVVQVGVADPARLHLHQRLTRTGVRHVDRHELDRLTLATGDDALHLMHAVSQPRSRKNCNHRVTGPRQGVWW